MPTCGPRNVRGHVATVARAPVRSLVPTCEPSPVGTFRGLVRTCAPTDEGSRVPTNAGKYGRTDAGTHGPTFPRLLLLFNSDKQTNPARRHYRPAGLYPRKDTPPMSSRKLPPDDSIDPDHQASRILAAFATWLREKPKDRTIVLMHDARGFLVGFDEHRRARGSTLQDATAQVAQTLRFEERDGR